MSESREKCVFETFSSAVRAKNSNYSEQFKGRSGIAEEAGESNRKTQETTRIAQYKSCANGQCEVIGATQQMCQCCRLKRYKSKLGKR